MSLLKKYKFNVITLRCLLLLLVLSLLASSFINVVAQTEDIDDLTWSQPLNLSQSSGSSRPGMVLDSNNVLHVFWEDVYRGYLYRKFEDGSWSDEKAANFPFKTSVDTTTTDGETTLYNKPPVFISDKNGRVHAIWIDKRNVLYHSYVQEKSFGNYASWLPPQAISEAVADMDAEIDSEGDVHLVYVKSSKSVFEKSGVYYRKLVNGGYWERTVLLYESLYLRSINELSSSVDISTATMEDGSVKLYVVWDNRALNRIYGINFEEGAWGEAFEIEGPNVSSTAVQPINGMVASKGDQVVYLWQLSQPGGGCVQYYQSSNDAGKSWGERRSMLMELKDCPDRNTILMGQNSSIVLSSILNSQIYMSVWNGEEWSKPELQVELSEYVDPETLNLLALEDPQFVITPENLIYVMGRSNPLGGGGADVWVTSRSLGSEKAWFPDGNKWTNFESVMQTASSVSSYSIVSDEEGWMHVFWSTKVSVGDDSSDRKIFYSRWDGQTWSDPVDVIISTSGDISPIKAAIDDHQKLILAWADNDSGVIYVSSANKLEALTSREWSKPVSIPSSGPLSMSPDIAIGDDGKIYLAFAIPINEFRGIYLTTSEDSGETWKDPILVYDGVAQGWLRVEEPRIAISGNNDVFIMFARRLLPLDEDKKELYFIKSGDEGQNWEKPILVSANPVEWWGMITAQNAVNCLWLEKNGEINNYYLDVSHDNGTSWNKTSSIQEVVDKSFPTGFAIDSFGVVHLIQMRTEGTRKGILQHWVLQDGQWYVAEKYDLGIDPRVNVDEILLTVLPDNKLAAVFTGQMMSELDESISDGMYFTTYISNESDEIQVQPTETISPVSTEQISGAENGIGEDVVRTVEITVTPTISFEGDAPVAAASSSMQRILLGTGVGVLAAVLIVVGFLFVSRKLK